MGAGSRAVGGPGRRRATPASHDADSGSQERIDTTTGTPTPLATLGTDGMYRFAREILIFKDGFQTGNTSKGGRRPSADALPRRSAVAAAQPVDPRGDHVRRLLVSCLRNLFNAEQSPRNDEVREIHAFLRCRYPSNSSADFGDMTLAGC